MTSLISRCAVIVTAAGALVVGGLPAANGVPSAPHASKVTLGNACLVGTWRDGPSPSSTTWDGHPVAMAFGGGDIDHINAQGVDHDSFTHAKPFIGTFRKHQLKETIRGNNLLQLRALSGNRLRRTEKGWSKASTNRYVYRGQHVTGTLIQTGKSVAHYRCSATTLTFLTTHGKVIAKEKRISRKP